MNVVGSITRTHIHTHTVTVTISFIQFNIKWNFRCSYNSKIDATHSDCCSDRSKCTLHNRLYSTVCTHWCYTHILQLCVLLLLFCSAYPCIAFRPIQTFWYKTAILCAIMCSAVLQEKERERRNRHMRYNDNDVSEHKNKLLLINVHWCRLVGLHKRTHIQCGMHIGTYVKVKCVVYGVLCMKCSFHSQS